MSTFSVGGLASGLDTKSIVEQLLQIEARPRVKKEWQKELWTQRKAIWSDVNTRLMALQSKATALYSPTLWSGAAGITSSDPTKLTAAASGPSPAAGTYSIDISSRAANEVWNAANATAPATGGARQSGTWYAGPFTQASGSTALTSLTTAGGMSLGLNVGSTITMSAAVNGSPVGGSFVVGAASTLDDLAQWAELSFPGATFTVNGDGTITFQSAAGATNEITSMSFTATNSGGTPLAAFNASPGASSSFVAPPSGGTGADTLTITQGASSWNVAIAAGSDDAAIAAAINGTSGIGVNATVVAGKLRLTSTVDGASGAFNVTSAGSLATDLGLAQTTAGADASFSVDGTAYTRATNTISDVITDVSFDLLATTTSSVTLTVGTGNGDTTEIKKKLRDFVDQYNSIVDFINSKTSEKKVINAQNLGDYLKGPLGRDYTLSSVAFDLRRWMTQEVSGLASDRDTIDDVGITTGALGLGILTNPNGRLEIDETALDAALASDPNMVKDMFNKVGTTKEDSGIARRISMLVGELRIGGKVDAALQGATRQVTDAQDRIDVLNDRLERKRAYYERMFSSLETMLGKYQSQSSWISGQLAALSGGQA